MRLLSVIAGIFTAFAVGRVSSEAWPRRIEVYGRTLRVGATLPFFAGFSREGIEVGPAEPSGRFHVHLVGGDSGFPCLDLECSDKAAAIMRRGGHVQAHDFKIAEAFGIPRVHDGVDFRFADKLLIVTDGVGKVSAIFRYADLADLDLVEGVLEGRLRAVDFVDRGIGKVLAFLGSDRLAVDTGDQLRALLQ